MQSPYAGVEPHQVIAPENSKDSDDIDMIVEQLPQYILNRLTEGPCLKYHGKDNYLKKLSKQG